MRSHNFKKNPGCGRARPAGFTLIEVLISLIILAIGISGIAAMQVSTYRHLHTSNNLSKATSLASEIAERMLANDPNSLSDYVHDSAPTSPPDCVEADCNFAAIAKYDQGQWQARLAAGGGGSLPSGSGEIENSGGGVYVITVRWDDDLSGSTGTDCAPADPNDLDCYALTVGF